MPGILSNFPKDYIVWFWPGRDNLLLAAGANWRNATRIVRMRQKDGLA